MALVTYIPRMLPMVLFADLNLPSFLKRFLKFIPYAALSALIFPEILFSTDNIKSALFGGLISFVLAFYNINLFFVVISGILGVLCWEIIL